MGQSAARYDESDVLPALRALFLESSGREAPIDEAETLLNTVEEQSPIVHAYGAMFTIMRAKYAFWPGKKMAYLNEGLPVLDSLVAAHPQHVEIRYLRLMGCYYLPRILRRSWSVKEDFEVLAELLPLARHAFQPSLYRDMVVFVRDYGDLPESRQRQLDLLLHPAADTKHSKPPASQ